MSTFDKHRFEVVNGQQLTLLIVPPIFFALATAAVALRWYARSLRRINSLIEDAFCLAGLLMSFLVVAIIYVMVFLAGEGLPTAVVTADRPLALRYWKRTQFAVDVCWATSVTAIQLSFLNLYLRLFDTRRTARLVCFTLMVLVSAWYIWCLAAWISHCHPPGKCDLQGRTACAVTGSIHVVFDVCIMVAAIPVALDARQLNSRKLSLTGLFLLGIFCITCAILRMDCVISFFNTDRTNDIIGAAWGRMLFSPLEIASGIICCCIPNLSPLGRDWRDQRRGPNQATVLRRLKFRSSSHGSSTSNLNPIFVGRTHGRANAFVSLEDGGNSNERVKDLAPQDIRVTKEYIVGRKV